jgi:hypothetical protein
MLEEHASVDTSDATASALETPDNKTTFGRFASAREALRACRPETIGKDFSDSSVSRSLSISKNPLSRPAAIERSWRILFVLSIQMPRLFAS